VAIHQLPEQPDFGAVETIAPTTADSRTRLLALIGNLTYCWSNNESLLIYVIMILLDTDELSAAIVFSSLNTTRARLDLIQRLARTKLSGTDVSSEVDDLIERFIDCTRERNDFNHCMYGVNSCGEITHLQTMKLRESRGHFHFGEIKKIDDRRIEALCRTIGELKRLNRDIWSILPRLEQCVRSLPSARTRRTG
jgi:hypothetical protein